VCDRLDGSRQNYVADLSRQLDCSRVHCVELRRNRSSSITNSKIELSIAPETMKSSDAPNAQKFRQWVRNSSKAHIPATAI
jgi:hypothetical protein